MFDGPTVHTTRHHVHVFALPQVHWEPVRTIASENVPAFGDLYSPIDGDRAQLGVNTVRLVPIAPAPAVQLLVDSHNAESSRAAAVFTLPFGISAVAEFGRPDLPPLLIQPSLSLQRARFEGFDGARQIVLEAGREEQPADFEALNILPFLPGAAIQERCYFVNGQDQEAPLGMLHPNDDEFDVVFGFNGIKERVPVSRVDLSGYGESCFSLWSDTVTPPPTVSQVRFDVLNGRTSREVVQVRTLVHPCRSIMVRTFTLERRASGIVTRHDSGWLSTTPAFSGAPAPMPKSIRASCEACTTSAACANSIGL